MKILLMKPGIYEQPDLEEYFLGMSFEVQTVLDIHALSRQLCRGPVDVLLYNVTALEDFGVIRYVNEHYPAVAVVVATENGMGSGIDNIRKGSYKSVRKPYHLDDLGILIGTCASRENKANNDPPDSSLNNKT